MDPNHGRIEMQWGRKAKQEGLKDVLKLQAAFIALATEGGSLPASADLHVAAAGGAGANPKRRKK